MPDNLLELKNDLVFQKIFGVQKNSNITAHFLSLILGREIHDVSLDANKRMLGNRADAKTCRLDIRVKFNNGEDCNIEIQVLPYEFMAERMLEYWAVMYDSKIHSGQGYDVLKPSISILIADYNLEQLKDVENYHTVWNLREANHPNKIISNTIEMHILEIPKVKNLEIFKDELAQWLRFIENPENKEVEKIMSENNFYKQAREELAHLSGDPDFQRILEARAGMLRDIDAFKKRAARDGHAEGHAKGLAEGHAEGRAEGLAEGLAEGERKKQEEIAKKMKAKNFSDKEISELTGLSENEIQNL